MVFKQSTLKLYALHKDTYISISIRPNKQSTKSSKKNLTKSVVHENKKAEPVINKNIDIGDIFSDVWTQKITKHKVKKKVNNKRVLEIGKRLKIKDSIKKQSILEEQNKQLKENYAKSTANEVNEYYAKIQALVYSHFNPPPNSQGNIVTAYIELDPFGKVLEFKILTYSSNKALNDECDKIRKRLINVIFPVNPEHKIYRGKIRIISKE